MSAFESVNFGDIIDFNFKDITNGGANRFWYDEKRDMLTVAGSDVGGRERFDDINDFLDRAIELYDGTVISGQQNVKYDGAGELGYSVQGEDSNIFKFGPDNHGGNTRVQFDDAADAANFMELISFLDNNVDLF